MGYGVVHPTARFRLTHACYAAAPVQNPFTTTISNDDEPAYTYNTAYNTAHDTPRRSASLTVGAQPQ